MKLLFLLLFGIAASYGSFGENPEWYLSNPMGMALRSLDEGSPSSGEWVLQVRYSSREQILTLYQKGVSDTLWIRTLDSSGNLIRAVEMKADAKVRETDYQAPQTRVLREKEYRESTLVSDSRLEWRDGKLVSRTVRGPENVLVFTDHFFYNPDGRLRRVERDGPGGPLGEAAWTYALDGSVNYEWTSDAGLGHFYAYTGEKADEVFFQGDQLLSHKTAQLTKNGQRNELQNGRTSDNQVQTSRDAQGRITEERTEKNGQVISKRIWSYDEKGRVSVASVLGQGQRSEVHYTYDADGVRTVENYRNGQLQSREAWTDGKKTSTEIYVRGEKVLEEVWEDGEKVSEKYFRDGQLVRERVLKNSGEQP